MKLLYQMYDFLRNNIRPMLIIVCAMTMAMFSLVTVYGKYRYQVYARDVYASGQLENAIYFYYDVSDMSAGREAAMEEYEIFYDEFNRKFADIKIISYTYDMLWRENDVLNMRYLSNEFITALPLPIEEGRWLSTSSDTTEAVIGGYTWMDIEVGDVIEINDITATVVGRTYDLVILPSLSSYGTYLCADDLFQVTDGAVFYNANTINVENYNYSLGCFIGFDSDISEKYKNECLDYLRDNGKYYTYEQIMMNTEENISEWLQDALPFPIFTISVSTILIFTMMIVMIQNKRIDQTKYYIMGCSKQKLIFISISSISGIMILPCFVNIFLALFSPNFLRVSSLSQIDYIIDVRNVLPILVYMCIMIILITIVMFTSYRKYVPIELYRNRE